MACLGVSCVGAESAEIERDVRRAVRRFALDLVAVAGDGISDDDVALIHPHCAGSSGLVVECLGRGRS